MKNNGHHAKKKKKITVSSEQKLYCYCSSPENGEMIECSKCLNWFHFKCVGVNKAAKKFYQDKEYICFTCKKIEKLEFGNEKAEIDRKTEIENMKANHENEIIKSKLEHEKLVAHLNKIHDDAIEFLENKYADKVKEFDEFQKFNIDVLQNNNFSREKEISSLKDTQKKLEMELNQKKKELKEYEIKSVANEKENCFFCNEFQQKIDQLQKNIFLLEKQQEEDKKEISMKEEHIKSNDHFIEMSVLQSKKLDQENEQKNEIISDLNTKIQKKNEIISNLNTEIQQKFSEIKRKDDEIRNLDNQLKSEIHKFQKEREANSESKKIIDELSKRNSHLSKIEKQGFEANEKLMVEIKLLRDEITTICKKRDQTLKQDDIIIDQLKYDYNCLYYQYDNFYKEYRFAMDELEKCRHRISIQDKDIAYYLNELVKFQNPARI